MRLVRRLGIDRRGKPCSHCFGFGGGGGELEEAQRVELGDEPACRAARAIVLLDSGEAEGALTEIERALAEAPDDPIVLRCAVPLLLLQDADRALIVARRAARLRSHDQAMVAMLISPLRASGEDAEVEALAEHPPAVFAGTLGHLLLRAVLAKERSDLSEAETLAREAVATASDNSGAWMQPATVLRDQDRREEAEQAACYVLEINLRHGQARRVLASIARKRGNEVEAKRLEAEARTLDPIAELTRPLEDGRRLFRAGRHDDMLDALGRLDTLPPFAWRAGVRMRLGLLARVGGTTELRQAVEAATGNDPTTTFARAELWMRDGRYTDARDILENAWAEGRPSPLAQFLLKARLHEDREAARELIRDLTAQPPGSLMGCLGVILVLIGSKMEEEYLGFLDAASRRYPHSRTLLRHRIRADMAYLRLLKAWYACDGLDPKDRTRLRLEIFAFAVRKSMKVRWQRALARLRSR